MIRKTVRCIILSTLIMVFALSACQKTEKTTTVTPGAAGPPGAPWSPWSPWCNRCNRILRTERCNRSHGKYRGFWSAREDRWRHHSSRSASEFWEITTRKIPEAVSFRDF